MEVCFSLSKGERNKLHSRTVGREKKIGQEENIKKRTQLLIEPYIHFDRKGCPVVAYKATNKDRQTPQKITVKIFDFFVFEFNGRSLHLVATDWRYSAF